MFFNTSIKLELLVVVVEIFVVVALVLLAVVKLLLVDNYSFLL